MAENLLSIDCGTQSIRVIIFSPEGEILEREKIEYEPYNSPEPGWAEQDPEIFWIELCAASRAICFRNPALMESVGGVGVTTQRDSMINVDEQGDPLRPVITWLDQRKAKPVYRPGGLTGLVYQVVGMDEAIGKTQADGKCNWIAQNEPSIWKKTHKYLQVSGFVNHRLTGRFVDSIASQIGHIPIDYRKMVWAKPGGLTGRMFPVDGEKLPEIVPPGQVLGEITRKAAEATGIPPGTPVIAAGSDKGCETIGMGVVDPAMASLSFGTTATVQTTYHKYVEPIRFMPAYPAPIPDHFNPEVEIFRGYWMISWFKREFGYKEILDAKREGITPEIILNRLLKEVPPGSMGLLVQPYWGPGLKEPAARGAIIGFGDIHTRAYMYRGMIEGLGYALKEGLHRIEKVTHKNVGLVAVSGGASQSDEICQISADIFNRPMVRGETWETSALGAAIITAVGIGLYSGFAESIKGMVRYGKTFHPDPINVALYERLFHVYKKIFPSLNHLYKELREITGYPEKVM
jgi:sugar (pentulose or hexulose) kinase